MQPTEPLIGTCAVCASMLQSEIIPLPGAKSGNQCTSCQKTVCAKCYSKSRKICVFCASGKDSWCTTPKFPKL